MMDAKTKKAMEQYREDLIKIHKKLKTKCTKEMNKAMEKTANVKVEYPTINAVDEAYACGSISSRKRYEYIKILSNANGNEQQSVNDVYMNIIERDINAITVELKLEGVF